MIFSTDTSHNCTLSCFNCTVFQIQGKCTRILSLFDMVLLKKGNWKNYSLNPMQYSLIQLS